jgi:hypothetical protein
MTSGSAIKKPISIEWYQWTGNVDSLEEWCDIHDLDFDGRFELSDDGLRVVTLNGTPNFVPNKYFIIKGVHKELYPCESDVFADSYNITIANGIIQ